MDVRATQRDPFELYIRDLESAVPLSQDEEAAHAKAIQDRRAELWRAALSYPPLNAAIGELVVETFDDDAAVAAARRVVEASSSARAVRTTRGGQALLAAAESLLGCAMPLDQDDVLVSKIARDAAALVDGRSEGLSLKVKRLPSLGRPFVAYVERVTTGLDELRRAKMAFARANLRLVVHMARRFERSPVALTDLIQEGNLGLMRAVDRFDHTRGFRFSTYATWWIRHSLNRAVLNTGRLVRVPVHVVERKREIARTRARLEEALGRKPTDAEVGDDLGLPEKKVAHNDVVIAAYTRSIDAPASGGEGATLGEVLPDDEAPAIDERVEWAQLGDRLDDAMDVLDAVERDIIQRRYGLGGEAETLREVGARHGLSRERIRQLQARALGKMRDALSA